MRKTEAIVVEADLQLAGQVQGGATCRAQLRDGRPCGRLLWAQHRGDVDAAPPTLQRRQQDQAHHLCNDMQEE